MSDCLCDQCAALCCRYFAMPIDTPRTLRQYDDIRWYLLHENVVVFIEDKEWYIGVLTRCKHLAKDNRCEIYETRPRICRGYNTDNCDWHGGEYDYEQLFTSGEQLMKYAREELRKERARKRLRSLKASRRNGRGVPSRVMGHPSRRRRKPKANGVPRRTPSVLSPFGKGEGRLALPVLAAR